ncbi:unnamed protein product [Paramecium sonneborni]|uniref:Tubby C-terminal domain-containing protein n=1 Tax=Paramecium sonneborni TaxID=65129 RepID=A0A8S1R6D4_9CILI|nr:unnamed protein product [Paramecium sonneborni]
MLPLPLQTRKMPKLEQMDLIEQGFGQNMSLYSEIPVQLQYCQFHKYNQKKDEFMIFKEDYSIYMYAKKQKNNWQIYTRDPSDSQFDKENFEWILKFEGEDVLSLWKKPSQLISIIKIIHCNNYGESYNRIRLLITNGKLQSVPIAFDLDNYPKDCAYISTIPPIYNSKKRVWYMSDSDRMQKASKRNFLLGLHNNKNEEKLQILKMGKIQTGVFIVDFKEPISLVIAFSVALATCELKSRIKNQ